MIALFAVDTSIYVAAEAVPVPPIALKILVILAVAEAPIAISQAEEAQPAVVIVHTIAVPPIVRVIVPQAVLIVVSFVRVTVWYRLLEE